MNPILLVSIGIAVAIGILIWVVVEIGRRRRRSKKRDAGVMHRWVAMNVEEVDVDKEREIKSGEHLKEHARVQQNGHRSGSNYPH